MWKGVVDEVCRKDGVIFIGAKGEADDLWSQLELCLITSNNSGKSSIHDNKGNKYRRSQRHNPNVAF